MSASLTEALTCGEPRSVSVINPELELEVELVVLLEEPTGPPLIHWPTAPFSEATVPLVGAVNVAAARLFCAVCNAPWAPVTCALAASSSGEVGPAVVDVNVARCVCSAA
jgi:hypothetical protein